MNNKYRTYRILLSLFFILFFSSAFTQTPLVKTFVDKNNILIGEQIKYKVSASLPAGVFKVNWFTVPDSMLHFETVERSKIDTSVINNNTLLEQTISFTSFDSGLWNTPVFVIKFIPLNNDSALNVYTDSIPINVGYSTADTTNQLRDIKPIMEVTIKNYLWYYIGGGILLLLVIAFLLRRYFKQRKKNTIPEFESKLSPYNEAIQLLEKLKQLNLQNPVELKQYHVRLAEILKGYISRKQGVSIMNKTTGDVLVHLSTNNLPQKVISNTATALRCGDAVKFAKFLPAASENEECLAKIKETINFIHTTKSLSS